MLRQAEPIDDMGKPLVELPADFTLELPKEPYQWVMRYLHKNDLLEHAIGWSAEEERLIFPVFDRADGNTLRMWSGRYFGKRSDRPKWYIKGDKSRFLDIIHSHKASKSLVFVEDRVSAIRVSSQCSSLCLYGTSFPYGHIGGLSKQYEEVILWLDSDMKAKMIKEAIHLKQWFKQVRVVFAQHDPKSYAPQEIGSYLGVSQ